MKEESCFLKKSPHARISSWDNNRRLIKLEKDIPPQEGDSEVILREGTRSSSKAFEEQTKRLVHVEASLQIHEMEIESGKK